MLAIKILLVEVSLTKSLTSYEVDADQLPLKVPNSCVTEISPALSNAKILFALSVAPTVNSVDVIVFVLESFMDLSVASDTCCAIIVARSRPSSFVSAGNGSLAI